MRAEPSSILMAQVGSADGMAVRSSGGEAGMRGGHIHDKFLTTECSYHI